MMISGQIITTSAEVTLNGGLIRELPQNPLNSGLGIILICPDDIFNDGKKSGQISSRPHTTDFPPKGSVLEGKWDPLFQGNLGW